MQEDVFTKRGHLEASYQHRANLFENLLKLTLNHALLEQEIFTHIADVRKDIIYKLKLPTKYQQSLINTLDDKTVLNTQELDEVLSGIKDNSLESSMGGLLGIIEKYPNIKSSETYFHMMHSLIQLEDLIVDRRTTYQETIRIFNRELSRFPWSHLTKVTSFTYFDYFEAEPDAHYRMQINASIREKLQQNKSTKEPVIPQAPNK